MLGTNYKIAMRTCLDCGRSEKIEKVDAPTRDFHLRPRDGIDRRGSAKTVIKRGANDVVATSILALEKKLRTTIALERSR